VTGTVYDSLKSRGPLAGATVVLVERDRYATTDELGRFRIDKIPDGRYSLAFSAPVLDAFELQLPPMPVEISGGRVSTVELATPSAATAYASICPDAHEADTGVIIGRVRDADAQTALADVIVSTDWMEYALVGGHAKGQRVSITSRTNRRGVYLLCGAPTKVPLEVRADLTGLIAGPVPVSISDRLMNRVDLALSRQDSSSRDLFQTDSTRASARGSATLRGVVRGSDGAGLRGADVGIANTDRLVHTDSAGAFRLDGIPAGTRTIEVKSIGFLPETFSLDFATNGSRDTTVSMSKRAQNLKAVTVEGEKDQNSLALQGGFYERRAHGLGTFVTDSAIALHNHSDLTAVLSEIQGIHIEYGVKRLPMPYLHGTKDGLCVPNVYLDGAPFWLDGSTRMPGGHPYSDLTDIVRPELIKAIEVYTTSGTIPAQFDLTSSTGCGSIVIWTR
jgi:hypothetical protein